MWDAGFFLIPSVSGFYWFLLALSTSLYMLMYILMFTSALTLHHRYTDRPKSFKIPYGHAGMWVTTLLGITACIITTIVSFFPPETIHVQNYSLLIAGAFLIMLSPLLLFFGYKKVYA